MEDSAMTHKFKRINKLGKIQEKIKNSSPEIEGAKYDEPPPLDCVGYCCCICPPDDPDAGVLAWMMGHCYTSEQAS